MYRLFYVNWSLILVQVYILKPNPESVEQFYHQFAKFTVNYVYNLQQLALLLVV